MTTKTEFIRKFLLDLDVLGVYHPDNHNEDEYDHYIDAIQTALDCKIHAKTVATFLVHNLSDCGDDVPRLTCFDKKIPSIIISYKKAKKEYKKSFPSK